MTDLRCDVRSVDSENNIVIAFTYCYDQSNQRLFRFERSKDETLKQTFARISLNINNCLNKKAKKSKNKTTVPHKDICIELKDRDTVFSEQTVNKDVWKEDQLLKVGDHCYRVVVNTAAVKAIRLPKAIMSPFIVYPNVVLEFCAPKDCRYQWYRKQTKSKDNEWDLVGEGFYYNTSSADIGSQLKVVCLPINGLPKEAISEEPVGANPGLCPFEERHVFCKEETPSGSFRVVSYNILADIYADSDYSRNVLYPYCPSYALAIDYRKQLLIKEILGYNADIYCLQEVDKQVFNNDLNPIMSSLDNKHNGIFGEKGTTGEGLAIFYNTSKFELLSAKTFSYAKELKCNHLFAQLLKDVSVNEKLLERLIARKTVFQSILLKSVDNPNRAILLGNTHLYYHPDSDHIRLIQSYIFVKHLENYTKKLSKIAPNLIVSPLLCGDFNSCPEFGVLQLMTTGFVHKDIDDFKSNSDETIEGFDMSHELSLESACGQPVYTNYTPFFSGCLDYIFYDSKELIVSEVIPLPSHEQVIQNIALPSVLFPSDHLALISTFRWKLS